MAQYTAFTKESSWLSAAINGHAGVFPQADAIIRDGWAWFSRDGNYVWECNEDYARAHFRLEPAQ